jgi:hypothetical protein
MVGNDAVNYLDVLGLASSPDCTVGEKRARTDYSVTVIGGKEIDFNKMLDDIDDIVSGVKAIQKINGFRGFSKSVLAGGAKAGAGALNRIMSEAKVAPGMAKTVNDAADAIAANVRDLVGSLENSDMRGAMIIVYVTCGECECVDPWIGSSYNKLVWDDPQKFSYVVLRDGSFMTKDDYDNDHTRTRLPKRGIDITALDLAIAERDALDKAKCNE